VMPMQKIPNLGCGEACPAETAMPSVYDSTGHGFSTAHCENYSIIDERADDADISATYMRAEFEQESGFDPLAVSNISSGSTACNIDNLPIEKICEYAGIAPADCPAFNKEGKPCAFGLAQCIEYPGQYYVKKGKAIPDEIKSCGGTSYNPFDPGMSACCGVNKFSLYLREESDSTEKWVNSNWAQLSKCPGGMKTEEKGWAAYYLASNRYFGMQSATPGLLSDFVSQRDTNGDCCTGNSGSNTPCYQHYIAYLRSKTVQPAPGMNYGAQVMSRYSSAVSACGSDCPG